MKKLNCRMTPEEREQHERAVEICKMTDLQIDTYLKEVRTTCYNAGYQQGKCGQSVAEMEARRRGVKDFLFRLSCTAESGIGPATTAKLKELARKEGYPV